MEIRQKISQLLQNYFHSEGIELPAGIRIRACEDGYLLSVSNKTVYSGNMQSNDCAFETWAAAIYAATRKNIFLEVDGLIPCAAYEGQTHFCRFLYRVLRFGEQYAWFGTDGGLRREVRNFRSYLEGSVFINNVPREEAREKTAHNAENHVEWCATRQVDKQKLFFCPFGQFFMLPALPYSILPES